jgi:hypothetical protein
MEYESIADPNRCDGRDRYAALIAMLRAATAFVDALTLFGAEKCAPRTFMMLCPCVA